MAEFPDVFCWIKLVDGASGKAFSSGTEFHAPAKVVVRYVVANDSHKPAGPLTVTGVLRKNGVKVQPNAVPAQQITVQPNQIWKGEYVVSDATTGKDLFEASMLGDIGNWVDEEDEANNKAKATFAVSGVVPPK